MKQVCCHFRFLLRLIVGFHFLRTICPVNVEESIEEEREATIIVLKKLL